MSEKNRRRMEPETARRGWRGALGDPERRSALLRVVIRLALVVVLVVSLFELQAAATYRVPSGTVEFNLRPSWPGGRLIMPLGPAGEFRLHTHRTPIDIVVDYELDADTAALSALGDAVDDSAALKDSARDAFAAYLAGRVPWVLLAGAAAGALVASPRGRRLIRGAAVGAGVALAVVAIGGALTYATVDRTPSVEYRGLASNVSRVLPLVRILGGGGGEELTGLQDYIDGLETVAAQTSVSLQLPERRKVIRLLLAGDVHDNVLGMRAAARLAAGGGQPVDGVLLAGDLTDRGTRQEARLFLRVFDAAGAPVVMVGGNHEDRAAMSAFAAGGYQVLDDTAAKVAGVSVLGGCDPLAYSSRIDSDEELLETNAAGLAAILAGRERTPQVLLVHDVRQAADVIEARRDGGATIVIAYGNDHVAGVRRDGDLVLVDAGTAGASGYEAVGAASPAADEAADPAVGGRNQYTFQLLDFSRGARPEPVAVTTLSYSGSGRIGIEYTPLAQ